MCRRDGDRQHDDKGEEECGDDKEGDEDENGRDEGGHSAQGVHDSPGSGVGPCSQMRMWKGKGEGTDVLLQRPAGPWVGCGKEKGCIAAEVHWTLIPLESKKSDLQDGVICLSIC